MDHIMHHIISSYYSEYMQHVSNAVFLFFFLSCVQDDAYDMSRINPSIIFFA